MRRWIKAIVLVGLLVGGVLLAFRRAPQPAMVTLPDGTMFEVRKITTGPIHHFRYRYDNRWQDYLGYVLPQSLLARFPPALRSKLAPHIFDYTITNANPVVWTISSNRPSSDEFAIAVADQHGVEVRRASGNSASGPNNVLSMPVAGLPLVSPGLPPAAILALSSFTNSVVTTAPGSVAISSPALRATGSGLRVLAWQIEPLPRHSREITAGFYLARKRIGEFIMRNPAYNPTALHPEHLPQVKSIGEAQIKLLSVEASPSSDYARSVDWTITAEGGRDGESLTGWLFDSAQVFDDSGPVTFLPQLWWPAFDPKSRRQPPLQFRGAWPDTAWKLRLWAFQRTGFASNEVWTIKDVPVNHAGAWKVDRHETRQVDGMTVELLGFLGPQTPGLLEVRRSQVNVCFTAPLRTEGVRIVFVRGWDDQNRPLESGGAVYLNAGVNFPESDPPAAPAQQPPPSYSTPVITQLMNWNSAAPARSSPPSYSFGFDPAPGAKTLTLEFAVTRTRFVDFIVQPTWAAQPGLTNSSAK